MESPPPTQRNDEWPLGSWQRGSHLNKIPDRKWPKTSLPYSKIPGWHQQDRSRGHHNKLWTWQPLFISHGQGISQYIRGRLRKPRGHTLLPQLEAPGGQLPPSSQNTTSKNQPELFKHNWLLCGRGGGRVVLLLLEDKPRSKETYWDTIIVTQMHHDTGRE